MADTSQSAALITGRFVLALLLIAAGIYVINRPGIWNKIR